MLYRLGLEVCIFRGEWGTDNYGVLTIHDSPPILNKAIHNFECLHSGGTSLVQSESVQSSENSLDLILSDHFLFEFLCAPCSVKVWHQRKKDSLSLPWLTCFVASARVERTSTIIFMTMSVMASVREILVYTSSLLTKLSMDSNKSTRAS